MCKQGLSARCSPLLWPWYLCRLRLSLLQFVSVWPPIWLKRRISVLGRQMWFLGCRTPRQPCAATDSGTGWYNCTWMHWLLASSALDSSALLVCRLQRRILTLRMRLWLFTINCCSTSSSTSWLVSNACLSKYTNLQTKRNQNILLPAWTQQSKDACYWRPLPPVLAITTTAATTAHTGESQSCLLGRATQPTSWGGMSHLGVRPFHPQSQLSEPEQPQSPHRWCQQRCYAQSGLPLPEPSHHCLVDTASTSLCPAQHAAQHNHNNSNNNNNKNNNNNDNDNNSYMKAFQLMMS